MLLDSLQELRFNDKVAFCETNICHDSYARGSVFPDLIFFFLPIRGEFVGGLTFSTDSVFLLASIFGVGQDRCLSGQIG